MAPRITHANRLDGAWWPSTTNLIEELNPLLRAVAKRLGQIRGVLLNRVEWPGTPVDWTPSGNRRVRIGWYGHQEPHTVVLISDNGKRVNLLVVPPHVDEASACLAMSLASTMDNALSGLDTLRVAQDPGHLAASGE